MDLIDTHCHLNMDQYSEDLESVINQSITENIIKFVVPGIDIESSRKAISLAEKYTAIYAAVGIHPNEGLSWNSNSCQELLILTKHPKVVAIGEIGLDYHWKDCPRDKQLKVFEEQLNLAEETHLPVIIHSRESLDDIFIQLEKWIKIRSGFSPNKLHGVLHAFEGDTVQGNLAVEMGFALGIGGPVTYKNAEDKRSLALQIDLKHILLETDSPYLTPEPYRGQRNHPRFINIIAQKIAQIRNMHIKLIAQATTKNANDLFAWEL